MTTSSSRMPYSAPTLSANAAIGQYRVAGAVNGHGVFTSPTESEFSETYRDGKESVLEWDELRVGEWLRSVNCAQYVDIFRRNNINGEYLMDMDQATLKEMGIMKIGDRVRIANGAKLFRNSVYKRTSKRNLNRLSLATLDNNVTLTPPSSGSPRPLRSGKDGVSTRAEKRSSRQITGADMRGISNIALSSSRPSSPMIDQENRSAGLRRPYVPSPMETSRKEQTNGYFSRPPSGGGRLVGSQRTTPMETPQTARFPSGHIRASSSVENLNSANIVGALPIDKLLIRVIYENGRYSVINIEGFRTAEDIIRTTLRKGTLNENHFRSYCFYVLDGIDPDASFCRRIGEAELIKLCNDGVRSERGRLILRKIHAGEPDGEQLRTAARIAEQLKVAARIAQQQQPEPAAIEVQNVDKSRAQLKLEKLSGAALPASSYPMSPASQKERSDYFDTHNSSFQRSASQASSSASVRAKRLKEFYGARPPTQLITQDLQSYFPEVNKEEIDRTVRMSMRRSQRLSRALNRLSTVSNVSVTPGMNDAPPLPSIADQWFREGDGRPRLPSLRPLSVMRLGRPDSYRDSVASTVLEPLDEESPLEPDRKSYVSFGGDSGSDSATSRNIAVTDPDGNTITSYFDDTGSQSQPGTDVDGSLNARLSQFIAEDGEEPDDELMEHLEKDSWDDLKYMKGAMIGQGSFGTVFLALHAVTAELMAVKQVEMPSSGGTTMDVKKNNMIEALKHEITLLRDLKHPNIVQYLGSNSDETHLNIFLEYVAGGSVATMLVNYGSFVETLIANFVRQILQGLNYLHSKDIIHRDIKGANILVDNKGTVKISDFGISKRVEASTLLHPQPPFKRGGPRVSLQGSVFWMAPEVVRQTAYTKKADIWSLGCLIVEMFTGSHPHPDLSQLQAIFKIGGSGSASPDHARPDLPEKASEEAKEFLRRTFEIEHEKRPTAQELMEYPFCAAKT